MSIQSLIHWDESLSRKVQIKNSRSPMHLAAALFAHSGDSWFWLAGMVGIYVLAEPDWKLRAAIFAASVFILAVIVMLIKFTVRRSRPAGEWGKLYRATDPHSFPSGHAARAFLLAVLGIGLGPAWLAILLIAWAPIVSLARVALAVHYASDVLVGMIIGIAAGIFILASQNIWMPVLISILGRIPFIPI